MAFVIHDHNIYYLAEMVRVDGKRMLKRIRQATEAEIKVYHAMKRTDPAPQICDNPSCDKKYTISRAQKTKLKLTNPRRGKLEFGYCSKECQVGHLMSLRKPN